MAGNSLTIDVATYRLLTQRKNLDLIVQAAASVTAEIMINTVSSTTGTGKAYKRNGRVHVASSPGSAPVKDSGSLAGSINVVLGKAIDQSDVVIQSPYALDLEFGTSKMRSRPFIRRSLNEALSKRLPEIIGKVISYINMNKPAEVEPYLESVIKTSEMTTEEAKAIVEDLISTLKSKIRSRTSSPEEISR